MEESDILDFDRLLAPISEDAPVGVDPRQDISVNSLYLKMKDARSEARRLERAMDTDGDGPSADPFWENVLLTGCEILDSQGKDLEVAAWIVEALTRLKGFDGLLAGLRLCLALIEAWDVIHPLPDEDGVENRLLPYLGLNGQSEDSPLIQCLRNLPITGGGAGYSQWQYLKAVEISGISDSAVRDEKISAGNVSLEEFNLSVAQTPPAFFAQLVEKLLLLTDVLDQLYNSFFQHVGVEAPPVSAIVNALQQILDSVRLFAKDKLAFAAAKAEQSLQEERLVDNIDDDGTAAEPSLYNNTVTDRETALRQLQKIALFFRQNEPHSPISYTIEELIKRARMSLPELLNELIVDDDARRYFFISTGMGAPKIDSMSSNGSSDEE
jgi:type VI secretion system protein ImpA